MGLIDYSDFKGLTYKEKTHKISKIRELVNRLFADTEYKMERLNNINLGIRNIKTRIDDTVIEEPIPIPPIPPEPTDCYIIVHGHNPEDKEINTITGVGNAVIVYSDGISIGYTGHSPITILSGHHTIGVEFNGITLEQDVDIEGGSTRIFTFVFNRTAVSVGDLIKGNLTQSANNTQICNEGTTNVECSTTNLVGNIYISVYYGTKVSVGINSTGEIDFAYPLFYNHILATVTSEVLEGDPSGYQWGHGGTEILLEEISKAFPIRTDFLNWFVQDSPYTNGTVVGLLKKVGELYPDSFDLLHSYQIGYRLDLLSTERDFNYLGVNLGTGASVEHPPLGGFIMEDTYSVSMDNTLKISSVPYDLDGLAI